MPLQKNKIKNNTEKNIFSLPIYHTMLAQMDVAMDIHTDKAICRGCLTAKTMWYEV